MNTTQPPALMPTGWWLTAANPPCRPWCTLGDQHACNEFAREGSLRCSHVVAKGDFYTIEVTQVTAVTNDGVELGPAEILDFCDGQSEDCTLDEVEEHAKGLLLAVEFAREVSP